MFYIAFYIKSLLVVLFVMVSVAFTTLLERKVLSLIGLRMGPFKVSWLGILQPVSDAFKLSNKQVNSLINFSFFYYYLSSIMMLFSSLFLWMCLFSEPNPVSFKFSLFIFMILLSLNSFNSILAGWSTFSKFSLIGSIRTVSQLISYELCLYLCVFFFLYLFSNFSFYYFSFFSFWFFSIASPCCFFIWLPSFLAELNRTPYDFSEGESELVSGFNTEFGSKSFTLIFLAEYSNIIFFSLLSSFFFFYGLAYFFFLLILFYVIWIRSVLPRYRYDKLMLLAWKFFIPFLTVFFIFFLVLSDQF